MNEVNMKVTSIEVKAEVRELRCEWTREMANEIHSYSGMDNDFGLGDFIRTTSRKDSIDNIFKITKHDK